MLYKYMYVVLLSFLIQGCKVPPLIQRVAHDKVPTAYAGRQDTLNPAQIVWQKYFTDKNLTALIDTALKNNQELNMMLQEIKVLQNEVQARKGAYLPFATTFGGAGVEKAGHYTRNGAVDENLNITPTHRIPRFLPDFNLGVNVSWQVDIWKQLRNAKQSAIYRYLAANEGKNFMVTTLIAEIAHTYYELMALDSQLELLKKTIRVQQNALNLVTLEKNAGQVTELAVRRFQAEVSKNQSLQYYIQQAITETENRVNFLVGRFPQPVVRDSNFNDLKPDSVSAGIPSQLLQNRPDIKQAKYGLMATNLDIAVAKANFYPILNLNASLGYQAFSPKYLLSTPKSILFNLLGGLVAPLANKNAIKATYYTANARQIQAVFNYERTILNAYIEVLNQLAEIDNLTQSYTFKVQQTDALNRSVSISINLFKSGRADYVEILLTQRDAMEAQMELIEIRKQRMNAVVRMYQLLGGGWR